MAASVGSVGFSFLPVSALVRPAAIAVVIVWAVMWQAGALRWRLPEHRVSVPRGMWLAWDHRVAGFVYGAAMGVGVLTHVRYATFDVVVAWLVLYGNPQTGMLVMATYGLARAFAALIISPLIVSASDPGGTAHRVRTVVNRHAGLIASINVVAILGASAVWGLLARVDARIF